jgi:GntR family transcriptional regulator, rspAB operon transcriptional repressor
MTGGNCGACTDDRIGRSLLRPLTRLTAERTYTYLNTSTYTYMHGDPLSSHSVLEPVRTSTETLTEIVFDSIKSAILNKALPPGGRVREAALAAQLNVSKTPVREALLRLRHIGLVEETTDGLSVARSSVEATREAYEHRIGLERMATELAARRIEKGLLAEIREAAEDSLRCARADNRDGFRAADQQFHTGIARAAGNRRLAEAIDECLVLIGVIRARDVADLGESVSCGEEHVAIAKAMASADPEAAATRMQRHIEHVMGMALSAFDGINQTPIP